jgi:hypothetical protein
MLRMTGLQAAENWDRCLSVILNAVCGLVIRSGGLTFTAQAAQISVLSALSTHSHRQRGGTRKNSALFYVTICQGSVPG